MSSDFSTRLTQVRERIAQAAQRAGRDAATITLVAVSKQQDISAIHAAYLAGQRIFGENYSHELVDKSDALSRLVPSEMPAPIWHFIGHLQRKKARFVVGRAALIHSVDSIPLIGELDRRADEPQEVLLQLNLADETQKNGASPRDLATLLLAARHSKHVRCVGLMTMTPLSGDPEASRPYYRQLRDLAQRHDLPALSMGMSNDFEVAIEEGATLVRVGSALFGPRAAKG
jgi:PLP dependent protein